jgi:hypothetical protein
MIYMQETLKVADTSESLERLACTSGRYRNISRAARSRVTTDLICPLSPSCLSSILHACARRDHLPLSLCNEDYSLVKLLVS